MDWQRSVFILGSIATLAAGFSPPAGAAGFNVELLDQLPLGPPETVTDVDVDGNFAFVGRGPQGLSIVDLSNPAALQVVGEFNLPGQLVVNDLQVANGRAYLTNESYNGVAVYILDVTDPTRPLGIGAILFPLLNSAHNLWAEGDILYVVGHESTTSWRTRIFDVSNPLVPILLAELPDVGAHDVTVLDGILYEAGGWSGLHLWDVSDPAHPVHLAAADENQGPRPHYHCHSVWPTEDHRHVVVMNELESWWGPGQVIAGGVKIFRWDGASQLELEATWQPEVAESSPYVAAHNVVVRGRYAYLSYYQAGLRVLDLDDPAQPVEVAFYDTFPDAPTALFQGAWGVDLKALGNSPPVILVSDRTAGLFSLRPKAVHRAPLAGSVHVRGNGAPIAGAVVKLVNAERTAFTPVDGAFEVMTGEGEHRLLITAPGFAPAELEIALTAGHHRPLWIELEPEGFATGVPAGPGAPPRLALGAAAPNPFQQSTQIAYTLPAGATGARLTVHDVAGRVVRELPITGAGAAVVWDGRDNAGRNVPAGVYHLRLAAHGETRALRVVRLD